MGSKTAFVTIVGRANAGKSSLLNYLIGEKIAMVTSKPQTTRTKITGISTEGETQYVYIDTPGLQKAKNKLGEEMNKAVKEAVSGIDAAVLVFDVTKKFGELESELINSLKKDKTPIILVLNKIDLLEDKSKIAEQISNFAQIHDFSAIIHVSILEKDGVELIKKEIEKYAVDGPHYFSDDSLTDQPEKVLAAEIIREKILNLMHDEIPHGIAVVVEKMSERVNKNDVDILDISATIYCERDSHKGMVIGKCGAMLKKIGEFSRRDLEAFFEIKVNLQLWVKVKPEWRNKDVLIKNFGLSNNSNDK